MLENRSFDHLFGRFPGANGARVGLRDGREVPLKDAPQWLPGDLPHDYAGALNCLNGGKQDAFDQGDWGPLFAYTQYTEEAVRNYWHWARNYVLCDNFFASALGPSYPNHLFFIAGQSGGVFDNPENLKTQTLSGRPVKTWGCDANSDAWVFTRDEKGLISKHTTCFDFPTVGDQLGERGIDWAYYAALPQQAGYIWSAYSSIEHIFHSETWDRHIRPVDRLLRDIDDGQLPSVTWITPRFELSDHPPWSTCYSQNWVTRIVNGIMQSPMWKETAIFITWDEWGGFYDHIEPHAVDNVGLGFRVPLLVISPYAKKGYVDHALGEFSTPLRFIADNWGLDYLTDRIRNTHNFSHVFDFKAKPRDPDPRPAVPHCLGTPFTQYEDIKEWGRSFPLTD
jgi:phospholipase C